MKYLTLILLSLILLLSFISFFNLNGSWSIAKEQEEFPGKNTVDAFIELIESKKYSEAADLLLGTNPLFFSDLETKTKIKLELERMEESLGPILSVEHLEKKHLGTKTAHFRLIANHEKMPILYDLIFYKPKDTWGFIRIDMEDDLRPCNDRYHR